MTKQVVFTDAAPAAVGPYSQAIIASGGKTVFLSGQIGLEPATGELVSENFEGQVRQAFASANAIMAELIPQPFPARSTIGVASLPKGAQFEVEAILNF